MLARGEVWWGPALHKETAAYRPWLILSTEDHPFATEECICVAMTTQDRPKAVAVPDDAWVAGGSKKSAFVSPWYVTTMKHGSFDRQQGTLDDALVGRVARSLHSYVPATAES